MTAESFSRPEIPAQDELEKLPKDGGEKWNRLVFEQSPYLLQHAANPVDWYPWGEEAFAEAKKQDKPVFLSIGYSTCHWCHVMEHESFENPEIGKIMNDHFICIKVDREERPDIDTTYMAVTLAMTGQGGWPMTVLLTPDKLPFYAGTYLPPDSQYGRIGMREFIPAIADGWKTDRLSIVKSAREIADHVAEASRSGAGAAISDQSVLKALKTFDEQFDETHGGMMGGRNKFPSPHQYLFLLRNAYRHEKPERIAQVVDVTLDNMSRGGIFDHVGFGFHRYATDTEWLLPHFEKMLYDQAMITMLYIEAYLATGNEQYRQTAEEIITYVLRDMTAPEGGFYSAEDADSEGEEGKFYVWSVEEIDALLSAEDSKLYKSVYAFKNEGNFRDESSGVLTGANIPHLQKSLAEWSKELEMPLEELKTRLESIRQKLFAEREKRIHPYKDDKILTDWNGLMIAALAKAGRALDNPEYIQAAEKAASFVHTSLKTEEGRLLKRSRLGQSGLPAHLDDYAFTILSLIELYQATFKVEYLEEAIRLTDLTQELFASPTGGYYLTAKDGEELIFRSKDGYDGAIPSGNSVMAENLARLARITARNDLKDRAAHTMEAFGKTVERHPTGHAHLLSAYDFLEGSGLEIVLSGDDVSELHQIANHKFLPRMVLLHRPNRKEPKIAELAPYTLEQVQQNNLSTAYVCQNYACELPVTSVDDFAKRLDK